MRHSPLLLTASVLSLLATAPAAHALTDVRDVVRNSWGNVVLNSFGNCVRTTWVNLRNECQPRAVAEAAYQQTTTNYEIAKDERTVYFAFDRSALTPESRAKLNTLAQNIRSNESIRGTRVVGYADRIGTPSYNEKLSKARADNVRKYLVSQNIVTSDQVETRWLGEEYPRTNCSDNLSRAALIQCLQPDRRVEVEMDYVAEQGTTTYSR